MHYCGLDVSRKSTHVYIEDVQGRRVKRAVVATTPDRPHGRRQAVRGAGAARRRRGRQPDGVDRGPAAELRTKVHVVRPLKVIRAVVGRELAALKTRRRRAARREVEAAARRLARAGWAVKTEVRRGVPLTEVLRAVSASRADLVVLGARGVGGVERWLLGSVAEGTLARAPVSVLLVKGGTGQNAGRKHQRRWSRRAGCHGRLAGVAPSRARGGAGADAPAACRLRQLPAADRTGARRRRREGARDALPPCSPIGQSRTRAHRRVYDQGFYDGIVAIHRLFWRRCGRPVQGRSRQWASRSDPAVHEAVATAPGNAAEAGLVVRETRRGWRLDGHLLRPARVVVTIVPSA
jgi:nucleotide-binding universal stress UspA family protein